MILMIWSQQIAIRKGKIMRLMTHALCILDFQTTYIHPCCVTGLLLITFHDCKTITIIIQSSQTEVSQQAPTPEQMQQRVSYPAPPRVRKSGSLRNFSWNFTNHLCINGASRNFRQHAPPLVRLNQLLPRRGINASYEENAIMEADLP